jgi:hypothetical protein|tara:strand:- start:91 stop:426 length:336 start_codon:yes stop_codon:yes gene_type:complete
VELDAAAVDEEPFRDAIDPGELGEDPFPHAAFGPAPEAVVERLLRTVDMFRAIAPATAALQSMDNPGEHPTVIDPRHTTRILRQKRFNPRPLLIRKPEEIRHPPHLLTGGR